MATALNQPNIEVEPGQPFSVTLEAVSDAPAGATYGYTLQVPDGTVLQSSGQGVLPYAPFLANGWNRQTRVLSGTAPAAGGHWVLLYTAVQAGGGGLFTSDFVLSAYPDLSSNIEPLVNAIPWRDRQGWVQDTGHSRVLLMSLPPYAPAGSGHLIGARQYLPIEGLLEFQPPAVDSDIQPLAIKIGADTGDRGVATRAEYQTVLKVTPGLARIAWSEHYASHGGPYGLRSAAYGKIDPPAWIYYDRGNTDTPGLIGPLQTGQRRGAIIAFWVGFIKRFVERTLPGGVFVDLVLAAQNRYRGRRPIPRTSADAWQLAATIDNAPSIRWPGG